MSSRAVYVIDREDQIAALVSPLRQEILDHVCLSGPSSISEMAVALGRAPDSLYFHVRKLLKVELLLPAGERAAGTRTEELFRAPARRVRIQTEDGAPDSNVRIVQAIRASLRTSMREIEARLRSGDSVGKGVRRTARAQRLKGWLTTQELAELNRLLDQVEDLVSDAKRREGAELHTVTLVSTRVESSERPRGSG